MSETYADMIKRHQTEINDFPCFWAFSQKQLDEGMRKLNLDPYRDKKKITCVMDGMFLLKSNTQKLEDMLARHKKELDDAIKSDVDGKKDGFMYGMFEYELANHEYAYTGDSEEALNACGITYDMLEKNAAMCKALALAEKEVMKNSIW